MLRYLVPDSERLPAGLELIYDTTASMHAYHFTERAQTLSFPATQLLPHCSIFPEEFSVLVTFRAGARTASRDETLVALMSPATTHARFGLRLYKGRLHVDYVDRRTRRRKVSEFKHGKITDRGWHTVIVAISADRVSVQTDCGKRRSKKLLRAFPAMIDVRHDRIHIGNANTGRFTVS